MCKKTEEQQNTERFDLISIGELSKMTNVNIKSLRYYEKIGVLLPVYVNPETGYRYYTYSQLQLVLSIQFFVDLGVPLQTLHQFMDEETQQINFADQISYGITTARQRITDLKKQIQHAQTLLQEIERCELVLGEKEPVLCAFPEKKCLAVPITPPITEQKYYEKLHQVFAAARKAGVKIACDTGILCIKKDAEQQFFVFSDISQMVRHWDAGSGVQYLQLPAAEYFCRPSEFFDLSEEDLLKEELPEQVEPEIVILTELFNKQFDYKDMLFELRWM